MSEVTATSIGELDGHVSGRAGRAAPRQSGRLSADKTKHADVCLAALNAAGRDTRIVQIGDRIEEGRRVRVIEWDADSSTDLSTLVVLLVVTVICPGAIICATQTTGWIRALFVAAAVLSGLLWVMLAGTFLVVAVVVTAVHARRITPAADALMAVAAAGLGAAAGSGTYESGPAALVLGPAVAAVVVIAVWSRMSSRAARIRLIALALLAAAASTAVGATIFL
jgi:hypothetical protein